MKSALWTIIRKLLGTTLLCLIATTTHAANCSTSVCVTRHDTIPNFAGQPTIRSASSGDWSNPATWSPARVPNSADVVAITSGTIVTYEAPSGSAKVVRIETSARLTFRSDISTRLSVGTILILPQGELHIGTQVAPIAANVGAEIVITNQALDVTDDGVGTYDPQQYGTGILAIDGQVWMHGAAKTTYARLAAEPRAGDLALRLATPVIGWRAGDKLFLPDSKHYARESMPYTFEGEEMTVASVSADG